jgi:hypothetical protein
MTIARKSQLAGVRRSHERVMRLCAECGEEFETSHNMEDTWRTCPACTLANRKERNEESKEEDRRCRQNRRDGRKHGMLHAYMVDYDPDESWGYQSMLTTMEVRSLLIDGNFSIGTRLKRDGKKFLVLRNTKKSARAKQCLEEEVTEQLSEER